MNYRIKFQVWSERKRQWRTAYVKPELLEQNATLLTAYGFEVRWDDPSKQWRMAA